MAFRTEAQLLELARSAYAYALDPARWETFLEQYRVTLSGSTVVFMFWERQTRNSAVSQATGIVGRAAVDAYNGYYAALNPLMRHGARFMRPGSIGLSQAKYPLEKFLRTEYYNDFARKLDVCYGVGACLAETSHMCAQLACLRPLSIGPYGPADVRFLRPLVPHIQRAFQLHLRLRGLHLDYRSEADALDALTSAVFVVSATGRVLLRNASATRLLAARDGLIESSDGLRASHPAESRALRELIAQAGRCASGESLHSGGVMRLSRPSQRTPLAVLVAPTAPALRYPTVSPAGVTIVVRDPESEAPPMDLLASRYGLTRMEARLAEQLLDGRTLREGSEALRIAHETARSHMKAILRKSGAKRQADFVRLAMGGVIGQLFPSAGAQARVDAAKRSPRTRPAA